MEGAADADPASGSVSPVPAVFAGLELTARLAYGSFELPVGVGAAVRLAEPSAPAFDPARDLGIYVFAGFDGFAVSGGELAGARPAPGFAR